MYVMFLQFIFNILQLYVATSPNAIKTNEI